MKSTGMKTIKSRKGQPELTKKESEPPYVIEIIS